MREYSLHDIFWQEFESIVLHICRNILGIGVSGFSEGPDGGRDGCFTGTAQRYPSEVDRWAGQFIVQAKHSADPSASCSDRDFYENQGSVLRKELPRLKKLADAGEVDCYLLFTNRRLTGGQKATLVNVIKNYTGVQNVDILGRPKINLEIQANPSIVEIFSLDRTHGPLRFDYKDLRSIILGFEETIAPAVDACLSRQVPKPFDLEEKNRINALGKNYFHIMKTQSESYFAEIEAFLKNPANYKLTQVYSDVTIEINNKIAIARDDYGAFEDIMRVLYDQMVEKLPDLRPRGLIWTFLHFMYFNCDIGQQP